MTLIFAFDLFIGLDTVPPGTLKVKNIYVDKTEISNLNWIEFLHYKKLELDSVSYQALLPDSANTWYWQPTHRFKPVVLISYEQALEYCRWRSEVVSKNMNRKVTYRLPSPDEWRAIASEQLLSNLKWVEKDYARTLKETLKRKDEYVLMERQKTQDQIYDLFNNVSEMTLEKGLALGANNIQLTSLSANITRSITYNAPHLYLGFRCVAEMD